MRFIGGVLDVLHKAKAAAIIQGLFEHQIRSGLCSFNAVDAASQLVDGAWLPRPGVFNGTRQSRPHRLAVAAVALGGGWDHYSNNREMQLAVLVALAQLLKEVGAKKDINFSNLDLKFIDMAVSALENMNSRLITFA